MFLFYLMQSVRLVLSDMQDLVIHVLLKHHLARMHQQQAPTDTLASNEFHISPNTSSSMIIEKDSFRSIICVAQKGEQNLETIRSILKSHGFCVSEMRFISNIVANEDQSVTVMY
jgi:hypothetical protein